MDCINFEFDMTLDDGRVLSVVGKSHVALGCDCAGGGLHPHIVENDYTSVLDIHTGTEIQLSAKLACALDIEADNIVYSVLKESA